eukprot:Opistho-2@81968
MGGVFTKSDEEYRISFVGLDAAGKTTALYKLKTGGDVVTTIPTIGFNVESVRYKNTLLDTWDMGGRGKMRVLWKYYLGGSSALIFMVDSNDRERFEDAQSELRSLLTLDDGLAPGCPVLVLANKQDLPFAASAEEVEHALELETVCEKHPWKVVKCCLRERTDEGIDEGMAWILSVVRNSGSAVPEHVPSRTKEDDNTGKLSKRTSKYDSNDSSKFSIVRTTRNFIKLVL